MAEPRLEQGQFIRFQLFHDTLGLVCACNEMVDYNAFHLEQLVVAGSNFLHIFGQLTDCTAGGFVAVEGDETAFSGNYAGEGEEIVSRRFGRRGNTI